jgi:lipopolysaccharide transport system permease protein
MNYQPTSIELPLTLIRPTAGWIPLRLRDLWEYRELIYFLAWRDLKVRYRQTTLGITWVVLQPLLMTIVFGLFFGRFAAIPSDTIDIPYPVFAFCGLLTWQFFSYVLVNSSNSLVASERLITKIYFPRLVIPLSGMLSGLVDFAIGLLFLSAIMAWYGIAPAGNIWMLPLFVAMLMAHAAGVGLWLAALNLKYRDVRHVIPFVSQLWFFVSPVVYPTGFIPRRVALGIRCQSNGRRDPRSSLVPSE